MFWKRNTGSKHREIQNLIWYLEKETGAQWMDKQFYKVWIIGMCEAFDILGMDRFKQSFKNIQGDSHNDDLVPVQDKKNKQLLEHTMKKMNGVNPKLQLIRGKCFLALRYLGDKSNALKDWQGIVKLWKYTTVVTLATQGLGYYVEGSQAGYNPRTKFLFNPSNYVEKLGYPNEPNWLVHISNYNITIVGDWGEIEKTRRELGLNIFQMLAMRINEELEKVLKIK
jgi:hypothetical protein